MNVPRQPQRAAGGALHRLLTGLFLGLLRLYQIAISPLLGAHCRFAPSCSVFCQDAIRVHGPIKGLLLGTRRLLRCHPWGDHGYDPVPPAQR